MEQQSTQDPKDVVLIAFLETFDTQTEYMGSVVQFIDWMKQYIRSGRMLSRVCLANAPMDSEAERDLKAMSQFLSDVEVWIELQGQAIGERYDDLLIAKSFFKEAVTQPSADDQAGTSASPQD